MRELNKLVFQGSYKLCTPVLYDNIHAVYGRIWPIVSFLRICYGYLSRDRQKGHAVITVDIIHPHSDCIGTTPGLLSTRS